MYKIENNLGRFDPKKIENFRPALKNLVLYKKNLYYFCGLFTLKGKSPVHLQGWRPQPQVGLGPLRGEGPHRRMCLLSGLV